MVYPHSSKQAFWKLVFSLPLQCDPIAKGHILVVVLLGTLAQPRKCMKQVSHLLQPYHLVVPTKAGEGAQASSWLVEMMAAEEERQCS